MKVQFFGVVAERAGRLTVEIADAPTVGAAVESLARAFPAAVDPSVRFAVNTDYADLSTNLHPGDVLSLIPPVGGG